MAELQRIILIGGGHAHLHVVKNAASLREAGGRVTVIDPGQLWYSGLATGMLSGMYDRDDDIVRVGRVASEAGVEFVPHRVVAIDRTSQTVTLDNDQAHSYDLLSINIGSRIDLRSLDAAPGEHLFTVKPISQMWALRQHIEEALESQRALRIVVIGGGATGCEVAANIDALARRHNQQLDLTVVHAGDALLAEHAPRAGRIMRRVFSARGVEARLNARAIRIEPGHVTLESGERVEADVTVVATGLHAPELAHHSGLAVDQNGRMRTRPTLQSIDDDRVFGAGDCINFDDRNLPFVGVYGVRQAPVLLENLASSLQDNPLNEYDPQEKFLSILNLGDGTALAIRGWFTWHGRLAMKWKNWLDRKFLNRFK